MNNLLRNYSEPSVQRSASVRRWPALPKYPPTPVHLLVEGHETLYSCPPVPGCGFGAGWIVHLVPSQRSASTPPAEEPSKEEPTAVQALAFAHDTPSSLLLGKSVLLGVGMIAHCSPFQRSARVPSIPLVELETPAAMQALPETQDTEIRPSSGGFVAFGVGSIVHLVPFQCSASVLSPTGPPGLHVPTAVHVLAEVQEIPLSPAETEPGGFGVRSIVHFLPFQRSASVLLVPS